LNVMSKCFLAIEYSSAISDLRISVRAESKLSSYRKGL
jgi:hypothetical protein